ncbi:MAG: Phage integrase family protein [Devosia sp.]|nr:Phage integrase family protein [Devosia sp.]
MGISHYDPVATGRPAWNDGKQVDAKRAFKIRQIWSIRFFLDREGRMRDRALFDLAIDSKLRGCDLVKIKTGTLAAGQAIRARSMVIQQKTADRSSSR